MGDNLKPSEYICSVCGWDINDCKGKHTLYCPECSKEHEQIAFCTNCERCLYKHSKNLNDNEYPLFQCECGQVNFWD
jgi:hypothetical protein